MILLRVVDSKLCLAFGCPLKYDLQMGRDGSSLGWNFRHVLKTVKVVSLRVVDSKLCLAFGCPLKYDLQMGRGGSSLGWNFRQNDVLKTVIPQRKTSGVVGKRRDIVKKKLGSNPLKHHPKLLQGEFPLSDSESCMPWR